MFEIIIVFLFISMIYLCSQERDKQSVYWGYLAKGMSWVVETVKRIFVPK